MSTTNQIKFDKLPKWAQEHICKLERERDSAVALAARLTEGQKESPVYIDDWRSNPPVKRYIAMHYGRLVVRHAGVQAEILLAREDDSQRLHGIEIQWTRVGQWGAPESIALVPRGHGNIQLVAKEYLR